MPPPIADRCDLAVWEMGPGLLGAFSDRLAGARSLHGPLVDLITGNLHERRILVASLKTNRLSEALQAVAAAHRPRQTLLMGPAVAVAKNWAPGALLHATRIEREDDEAISVPSIDPQPQRCGICGDGPISLAERPDVMATSNWAYDAGRAAERGGVVVAIALALIGPSPAELGSEQVIVPPDRIGRSLARRAGGVVGSLWRQPKSVGALWKKQSTRWEQGEQFADALEELVQRLP